MRSMKKEISGVRFFLPMDPDSGLGAVVDSLFSIINVLWNKYAIVKGRKSTGGRKSNGFNWFGFWVA